MQIRTKQKTYKRKPRLRKNLPVKQSAYAVKIEIDLTSGNCYFTPQQHPIGELLNREIGEVAFTKTQSLPRRWVVSLNGTRIARLISLLNGYKEHLKPSQLDSLIQAFNDYRNYKAFAVIGIMIGFAPALKVKLYNVSPDVQVNQLNSRCQVKWKSIAELYQVPFEFADDYLTSLESLEVKIEWEVLDSGESARTEYLKYKSQPKVQAIIKNRQFQQEVSFKRTGFLNEVARKWRLFDFGALCVAKTGQTLNTAQQRAVESILRGIDAKLHGFILALDMGLGKTRIAALLATAAGAKTLIIAPGVVHRQWQTEMALIGYENYELSTWHHSSLAKFEDKDIEFIIADESHYPNGDYKKTSQATNFLALSKQAMFTLCLTGTPARNSHPGNLITMLKAIGAIVSSEQEKDFYLRFVKDLDTMPDKARYERLLSLASWVGSAMLVINAETILQMPEITYSVQRATPTLECQTRILSVYREINLNRKSYYAAILQTLNSLRKSFALAKIELAVAAINARLQLGEQVVVFSTFIDILRAIASHLPEMAVFTSTTTRSVASRNETIDNFQAGRVKVLGTTYGFGGTGLNLQQATTVIFVDLPWTPNECRQAIARIWRQRQTKSCNIIYLSCSLQEMPTNVINIDEFLEMMIIQKAVNDEAISHDKGEKAVKAYYNQMIGQLSNRGQSYAQATR
jgi:superfamily II DNA or RNA helicase